MNVSENEKARALFDDGYDKGVTLGEQIAQQIIRAGEILPSQGKDIMDYILKGIYLGMKDGFFKGMEPKAKVVTPVEPPVVEEPMLTLPIPLTQAPMQVVTTPPPIMTTPVVPEPLLVSRPIPIYKREIPPEEMPKVEDIPGNERIPCGCGCGELVWKFQYLDKRYGMSSGIRENRFVQYHVVKDVNSEPPIKLSPEEKARTKLCECGCGAIIPFFTEKGKERKFHQYHMLLRTAYKDEQRKFDAEQSLKKYGK